jgi:hypothetical protein
VLLVVDDVWELSQLRPFRIGGRCCTRLVTTRIPGVLPEQGVRILVDAMSGDQARQLVADGVAGLPADVAARLAELAGRWPVLLNLVNGGAARRVARGQPPARAAAEVVRHLVAEGPVAFDPARPADRSQAVAATIRASLALLDHDDQQRYLDLGDLSRGRRPPAGRAATAVARPPGRGAVRGAGRTWAGRRLPP